MQLKPLFDRVIIEREAAETQTASGIIIPSSATEAPLRGKVVAIGTGKRDANGKPIPMSVAVGDTVIYLKFGAHDLKEAGANLLVVKEDDLIAVVSTDNG